MSTVVKTILCASLAAGIPAHALGRTDLFGHEADTARTRRTVVIDAGTRYVNVRQGDIVTLRDGVHGITWQFDGLREVIPLSAIMPQAPHEAQVTVYVQIAPTP